MARALLATAMLTVMWTSPAQAEGSVEPTEETIAIANEAGVDSLDLQGAVNSTGLSPCQYLASVAAAEVDGCIGTALMITRPEPPPLSGRLACIAWQESRNNPNATNPRSKAAGLFQFLHSTWLTTPQGKAGMSPYDPTAATAAAQWMIGQGRVREWAVVQNGLC